MTRTLQNTLPDNRDVGGLRDAAAQRDDTDGDRAAGPGPGGRGVHNGAHGIGGDIAGAPPDRVRHRSGDGKACSMPGTGPAGRGARSAVVPLACLAVSIGLATSLLEPCLAAAGLPGTGAVLAASMAALFAVLLAIVSMSVAAAIAALLLSPVAGAALYAALHPSLRRPRVASPAPGVVTATLSDGGHTGRHGGTGPPGAAASPRAATLAGSSRDSP